MSEVGFLVGRDVVEVRVNADGSVRIIFDLGDEPEPMLYADVGDCVYEDREGNARPLSEMLSGVVSNTSTEGGTLFLSFADGRMLGCAPHPDYEAWEVVGGKPQNLVACLPGDGELAVWDSSHVPTAKEAQEAIELVNKLTRWDIRSWEISETGGILVHPPSQNPDREHS